jgi:hypothetical protein
LDKSNFFTARTLLLVFPSPAYKVLFWWVNLESLTASICITATTIVILGHVVTTYSSLGRIILATSAMGSTPILPKSEEEKLLPKQLTHLLLAECVLSKDLDTAVNRQYSRNTLHAANLQDELPFSYHESLRRRHPDINLDDIEEELDRV